MYVFNSIGRAVTIGGAGLLLIVGASSLAGLMGVRGVAAALDDATQTAALVQHHLTADMMHDAIRGDVLSAVLSQDPAFAGAFTDTRAALAEHVERLRAEVTASLAIVRDTDLAPAFVDIRSTLDAYAASAEIFVANMSTAGTRTDGAQAAAAYNDFLVQFEAVEASMAELSAAVEDRATASAVHSQRAANVSLVVCLVALALSLIVILAAIILTRRAVVRPLTQASRSLSRLADGATDIEVVTSNRRDEIGAMQAAIGRFLEARLERLRLTAEAERLRKDDERAKEEAATAKIKAAADLHARDLAARQAEEALRQERDAERLAADKAQRAAADNQARVINLLAAALERLAAGDLSAEISDVVPPEFQKLRDDYNNAIYALRSVMGEVSSNVAHIRTGSAEISTAANDLSLRTDQQVKGVENAAAALGQITVNVERTAGSANDAARIVGAAREDAETSGATVRRAVDAMRAIEDSAQRIARIIGVIDEIAFQTNLLALNAGVEAARAGEAGRGFAVVASEVRALAQRSADSAKEIKSLIGASVAQVADGSSLVKAAGDSLLRIIERVAQIDLVAQEIATSAKEQSLGLRQVHHSVQDIDRSTQQNAAMVEETTAASRALASEADNLDQLVRRFRLTDRKDLARRAAAA